MTEDRFFVVLATGVDVGSEARYSVKPKEVYCQPLAELAIRRVSSRRTSGPTRNVKKIKTKDDATSACVSSSKIPR